MSKESVKHLSLDPEEMAASPFKADANEASDPTRIEAIQSSPPPKT